MKSLFAEFTVKPSCETAAAALVGAFTQAVRGEPGNVTFVPFTRTAEPRSYVVFETYADEEAFAAHLGSEHNRAFNTALAELIETGASILTWLSQVEIA